MSRVLEALKTLDARQRVRPSASSRITSQEPCTTSVGKAAAADIVFAEQLPTEPEVRAIAAVLPEQAPRGCELPTNKIVSQPYLDLAERIAAQLTESGCNVLALVNCDDHGGRQFSLPQLARAISSTADGNVLLVDADLRGSRLSREIGLATSGMSELLMGAADWSDVIRPTTTPGVDFVPCGNRETSSFDRSEFNWRDPRATYRTVLVGLCGARSAQTGWLAARCDAAYLIVSRPHTLRQAARGALHDLRAGGANVLGCVVIDN